MQKTSYKLLGGHAFTCEGKYTYLDAGDLIELTDEEAKASIFENKLESINKSEKCIQEAELKAKQIINDANEEAIKIENDAEIRAKSIQAEAEEALKNVEEEVKRQVKLAKKAAKDKKKKKTDELNKDNEDG